MQIMQRAPQSTHGGVFCPMRGWLDEYALWRLPVGHPNHEGFADIAPYETADNRKYNEGA